MTRIIVGLLLILSILAAGCGKQSAFIAPPWPDQVKGSLAYSSGEKISTDELLAGLLNYRQKDLEETKRIAAIKDDARRKDEALEQWKKLWPFYLAWKENGGREYAGIRLYGPVAAGWMNEILLAMRAREAISGGKDISKTLSTMGSGKPELPQGSTFRRNVKSYELIGLADFDVWNIFRAEDLDLHYSDAEEVSHLMTVLESSSFPFNEGLFENTEVFLLPGMIFEHVIDEENMAGGAVLTYQPPTNGITPGSCVSPEAALNASRVIISLSDGMPGFPHELGHVWFLKQATNPHCIKNVHVTYAGFRRPAVPADLLEKPDSTLDDERIFLGGNAEMPWNLRPVEVLAEDFANLFFPGPMIGGWQHKWPNIFLVGKENEVIRDRLKNFFLTVPRQFEKYKMLKIDPLPKFGITEITGTLKPGIKVCLLADDDSTARVIDETITGSDGRFSLKMDPNLIAVGKGRVFRIALDCSTVRESTWKDIIVYK